jgi:hypothetical protein
MMMATTKESRKRDDEMTPEEREAEHARRLHEQVERIKKGEVKPGTTGEPGKRVAASDSDQ